MNHACIAEVEIFKIDNIPFNRFISQPNFQFHRKSKSAPVETVLDSGFQRSHSALGCHGDETLCFF